MFWGLQAAALWGPFSVQGEYARLNVDLPGGAAIPQQQLSSVLPTAPNPFIGVPDPEYTGWYVEGSWFFGGHKTYDYKRRGQVGGQPVNNPMFHGSGGWGALQIVGKYDVLDMSDTGNNVLNGNALPTVQTPSFVGACAITQLFPVQHTVASTSG